METLTQGKEHPLPIEQVASCAPGQALRLQKREKYLATISGYSAIG